MTTPRKIPVFSPIIGREETEYVNDCLSTHWISQGKYVKQFEEEFSRYSGCQYGIATNNGTTALHLAAVALGLKAGDEVLVSTSTNMASAFAMYYQGAIPVPVDIERDTWQLDVKQLERKITAKTKAIEVVHLFGHPVDMDPVLEIARKHDLKVIEDCAEAHGAEYKGRKVGSLGDLACFSFYANKIITCGEGGMVTTNDKALADRVRRFGNFCYGDKQKFMHDDVGYNYRLSNMSAALGLGQFRRLEQILERKREIHARYQKNLTGVRGFNIPAIRPWAKSVMWMFNVYLTPSEFGMTRDELCRNLAEMGIETREAFVPINKQKVFLSKGLVREDDCPVANDIMETGFYLPSGLTLSHDDIDYVCDAIKKLARH
ncbi:MAG: DegT/DnrJ/EryC1/StrS family aminotransferase [Deltaproteobacteria bacterium]|nr:DegT/DnrJ/EryC1/StrS family aminotransferase [Deltaproteobacteria bacterium]